MARTIRATHDSTTAKLLSPEHVFSSTCPNKYRDAIRRMVALLDSQNEDIALKAADKIINHTKGTPKQAIDHSNSDGSLKTVQPIIVNNPQEKALVEKIMSGQLKR